MNYSLLEEVDDNINDIIDKYKEINEELLCVKIMEDYNKLKKDLEKSKKELEDLYKKKEYFYNYQNNIYNGHLNILDIIENKDSGENLNEIIINYNILKLTLSKILSSQNRNFISCIHSFTFIVFYMSLTMKYVII